MSGDLWEAVEEEHERFRGVSCRDAVELDPIGSHSWEPRLESSRHAGGTKDRFKKRVISQENLQRLAGCDRW